MDEEKIDKLTHAVENLIRVFGVDPDEPDQLRELQKDFIHLREWRTTMEQVRRNTFFGVLGMLGASLVAGLYLGIQAWIRNLQQ